MADRIAGGMTAGADAGRRGAPSFTLLAVLRAACGAFRHEEPFTGRLVAEAVLFWSVGRAHA